MKHSPNKWELPALLDYVKHGGCEVGVTIAGMTRWSPARPEGFFSIVWRIRLALAVFKGEADALFWPE